ncbi:hypothetical protein PIB30_107195, partial [Stylosanthes scabra]|nr:hypothetical protein [Stylosanthes scabra]
MPRVKRPTKKSRGASSSMEPTPSRSSLGSMVLQQGGFRPLSVGFCIRESGSSK